MSTSAWQASSALEAADKPEEALRALDALPASERERYRALLRRGWLLYKLRRYEDSVVAYERAASLTPAAVEPRVALLVPLMALLRWPEVAFYAQQVLKRDPENYLALQRLAYAKFAMRQFAEAEVLYRRLVVLYPGDLDMRAGLGWAALRLGKSDEAAQLFREVVAISPQHASATEGLREAEER